VLFKELGVLLDFIFGPFAVILKDGMQVGEVDALLELAFLMDAY
jgi:hypothetical protein